MLPSASIGGRKKALHGMYEPVHGSAPDISGQDKANPLAMIQSFAMCLKYSFDMGEDADLIEQACKNVLDAGLRTPDILEAGMTKISTTDMGDHVTKELDKLSA